jgi:hypothetical protein
MSLCRLMRKEASALPLGWSKPLYRNLFVCVTVFKL